VCHRCRPTWAATVVLVDGGTHHPGRLPTPARVHLLLNANNLGHGMAFDAIIECEGPDSGELTIPRALIEAFPPVQGDLAACEGSDCPLSLLTRYLSAAVDLGGETDRVVFTIGSQRQFAIVHD
jgi:hypothetical protein